MEIKDKTKIAAHAARDMINSGMSVTSANEAFNQVAGFYLNHSGKRDFIRLLNWYADQQ